MPTALDQVPSGVAVCAHRIVGIAVQCQPACPGAAITVSVDHDATRSCRVANGPGGPVGPSANGAGPGHGLTGMRERVALLGGSLSVSPAPDGGTVVSAGLPLGEAA
jgi:signal transduction histidine kinase